MSNIKDWSVPVDIRNVGGVVDAHLIIAPGVVLARGANGSGKTSSLEAVRALAGEEGLRLVPRDGQPKGLVECAGLSIRVGKTMRSDGSPSIQLAAHDRFATLVRPRAVDLKVRNKERIKALLFFRPIAIDEQTLLRVCGYDQDLAAAVQGANPKWDDLAIDEIAEAARKVANKLALEQEGIAKHAESTASLLADQAGHEEPLPAGQGVDDLEREISRQSQRLGEMRATAQQREVLERQQADIRGSLGDRPDAAAAKERSEAARKRADDLRAELARADADLEAALTAAAQLDRESRAWDDRQEILGRPLSGATFLEVAEIEDLLDALRGDLATAKARAEWEVIRDQRRDQISAADAATIKATRYREIAQRASSAVAEILDGVGVEGLRIEDGELVAELPDGVLRNFEALSFGEQVRYAARVATPAYQQANLPVLFHFAEEFWAALDFHHQEELVRTAWELGICVTAEEPTEGQLRFLHLTPDTLHLLREAA